MILLKIMFLLFINVIVLDSTTTAAAAHETISTYSMFHPSDDQIINNPNDDSPRRGQEYYDDDEDNVGKFVWLSDLHLDPYFGTDLSFNGDSAHWGSDCSNPDNIDDASLGLFGCDAPMTLIDDALLACSKEIEKSMVDIDFILITGDFCRHGNEEFSNPMIGLYDVLYQLASKLNATFGHVAGEQNIPIIPTLGNNDVTPDYYLEIDDVEISNMTTTALTNDTNAPMNTQRVLDIVTSAFENTNFALFQSLEEIQTFRYGGYFARTITTLNGGTITVLSLNTIVYSINHQPDQTHLADPFNQFQWMETQLERIQQQQLYGNSNHNNNQTTTSKHKNKNNKNKNNKNNKNNRNAKVYITGHIPPTLGSYRHSQLWHEQYLIQYYDLMDKYSDVVAAQMFGHLHSDEFRLITPGSSEVEEEEVEEEADGNAAVVLENDNSRVHLNEKKQTAATSFPILLASSVTPIYGSNPSFRMVTYRDVVVDDGSTEDDDDDNDDTSLFGSLVDYETYYKNLADGDTQNGTEWQKLPSFRESYRVPDLSVSSLRKIMDAFDVTKKNITAIPSADSIPWSKWLSNETWFSNNETTTTTTTASNATESSDDEATITTTQEETQDERIMSIFLNRNHVNASHSDDDNGDDDDVCNANCQIEWYCTFQSITTRDFEDCKTTQHKVHNQHQLTALLEVMISVATAVGIVILCIGCPYFKCIRLYRKRNQYNQPMDFSQTPTNTNDIHRNRNREASNAHDLGLL